VNKNLPLLHRYMELRKRLLGVDTLHMYDLYTPVLGEAPVKFSYEDAKNKAVEALHPMGEEYLSRGKRSLF
jgi:oligoendopeptidase F